MKNYIITNPNLLYPELSFSINGVLFDVFKEIGGGHKEKIYQKAVKIGLEKKYFFRRTTLYPPYIW